MKEYLTHKETDEIFKTNTSFGCRDIEKDRFHQATNHAIYYYLKYKFIKEIYEELYKEHFHINNRLEPFIDLNAAILIINKYIEREI